MELIIEDKNSNKTSVWDNEVPIVKKDRVINCFLMSHIKEPEFYSELFYVIDNAYKGDIIRLYINNPGGVIDTGFLLVDAIKRSKATVEAHVSGTVASISTIIALACDKLFVADYTQWMVHNYSASNGYQKGHELKSQMEFMNRELNIAFKNEYVGFMTEEEIEQTIDGKDFWMCKEEVKERWNARKLKDAEKLEEITKKYKH